MKALMILFFYLFLLSIPVIGGTAEVWLKVSDYYTGELVVRQIDIFEQQPV